MLIVETVVRIRREHAAGKSIKAIVRDLRLSRKVVRKAIRSPEAAFNYQRKVQPLPRVGPFQDRLDTLLEENEARSRRDRLAATLTTSSKPTCAVCASGRATPDLRPTQRRALPTTLRSIPEKGVPLQRRYGVPFARRLTIPSNSRDQTCRSCGRSVRPLSQPSPSARCLPVWALLVPSRQCAISDVAACASYRQMPRLVSSDRHGGDGLAEPVLIAVFSSSASSPSCGTACERVTCGSKAAGDTEPWSSSLSPPRCSLL
ncbi:MAG: family transposase [Sphingomonas sp.]|nr:family transposase [Sphingomonas sp.]